MAGPLVPPGPLNDPEAKDIAACVWLGLTPRLGNQDIGNLVKNWTRIAARELKIPMGFVYGKGDTKGDNFAKDCLKNITNGVKGKLDFTGDKAIEDTAATDSKLLARTLGTEKWIVKSYLEPLMEKRSSREWQQRTTRDWRYFYVFPAPGSSNPLAGKRILGKQVTEEVPIVPLQVFFPSSN